MPKISADNQQWLDILDKTNYKIGEGIMYGSTLNRYGLYILMSTTGILPLAGTAYAETNLLSPIGLPAGSQPGSAAQDDGKADQIAPIIVTARKRAEDVQHIPEAITVMSSSQIRDTHLTKFDDLNSLVPNLNITTRADNTPDVVIRGVGAFGVTEGVGFYANDVQLFEGQTVRTEDLERIEVLRGPQGTLYGGNNIGGAIKFVTRKPTDIFSAEATAEFGNYNARTWSGAISGTLAAGLTARISAFDAVTDGFVFDPTLNRTLGHSNQRGARLTVAYHAGATDATFYLYGNRERSSNENLYYGAPDDHTYSRQTTANVLPSYKRDLYAPSLQIDHTFGSDVKLTSITSYFHAQIDARADGDHRAAPLFDVSQNFRRSVWSQELRLASVDSGAFSWLVGAFAQHRHSQSLEVTTQFLSPITGNPGDDGVFPSANRHIQREYALFANGSYTLDQFTLEAGLRGERFINSLIDTIAVPATPQMQVSGTEFLPKASLSYRFNPNVMTYTSFSRGLQPADILQAHGAISSFRSEKTSNFELGLKSTILDKKVRLNLATFYIKYDNRLFNTIDGTTLQEVTLNVGPSHNYGIEGDILFRATSALTLTGGFGITKAKWDNVPGYFNPNTGMTINLKGLTAPFAPEYQANFAIEWQHAISDRVKLTTRADISFHGKQYWNISDDYSQRPYQLVNLLARVSIGKHFDLTASGKNLFDVQYHTIFAGGPDIGSPFNTAGFSTPRQWSLSATVKY